MNIQGGTAASKRLFFNFLIMAVFIAKKVPEPKTLARGNPERIRVVLNRRVWLLFNHFDEPSGFICLLIIHKSSASGKFFLVFRSIR